MKPIEPNFKTPADALSKEELNKLNARFARGHLQEDFRNLEIDTIVWESEQLAKSHGIYVEFNRAKTGEEKDWMYMIRITIPGGGPITREQWRILDQISDKYTVNPEGFPSLRLTTRQNIQYHWIKHKHLKEMVREIASTGFYTLNGCGDNVRNVMGCPLSTYSTLYDANKMARKFGEYFRLPAEPHIEIFEIDTKYIRTPEERYDYTPQLLNRKFKIAFSSVFLDESTGRYVYDNCVELRTNDLGVAPIVENGKVERFQVYIGGGQGEKNGKASMAVLGEPFGIFREEDLLKGLHDIVKVHEEWGDRQNRVWARIKYVVRKKGIAWFQEQVREKGARFDLPDPAFDPGPRHLHFGWHKQAADGKWTYGAFIENGRLIDNGKHGNSKAMVRYLMDHYPVVATISANQDILFHNIPEDQKASFENDMKRFGYGTRNGKPYSTLRQHSVACVGLDTCRLSYTDSEKLLPVLMDQLEEMGYGDVKESIGISGCERQCSRPATKTIGWVGGGKNLYRLKIMGCEDARHQGEPIVDDQELMYLSTVPKEELANVSALLMDYHRENRKGDETLGYFLRRVGMPAVIAYLKQHPKTAQLMSKVRKVT